MWRQTDKHTRISCSSLSFLLQSNNRAAQISGVFTVPGIFQFEHRRGPPSPAELRQRCGDYGHSNQPCRTWTSGRQTHVNIRISQRHLPVVNQRKKEDFKRQQINNRLTDKINWRFQHSQPFSPVFGWSYGGKKVGRVGACLSQALNIMSAFQRRWTESMHSIDGWLFTPPSIVAIRNRYEHICPQIVQLGYLGV